MAGIFIPGNTISLGAQGSGGGAYSPIGASFDAVYTQDLYSDFGVASTAAAIHSVTRASTKYVEDTSGLWTSVSANTLARSNKGVLIEESRTNSIRNNSMQGAAAGTPGTLPTNWSASVAGGLTRTVVGTGTANGIEYIDVRVQGTTTDTSLALSLNLDGAAVIAASVGQNWTQSAFISVTSGTLTGVSSITYSIQERTAGSGLNFKTSSDFKSSLSAVVSRPTFATTLTDATVAFIYPAIWVASTGSGVAIDITLRIGWPQLELGAFATSPIRTTSSSATRAADAITIDPKYSFFTQGSAYVEWEEALGPISATRYLWSMRVDGNNAIRSAITIGNKAQFEHLQTGTTVAVTSSNNVAAINTYKMASAWNASDMRMSTTASLDASIKSASVAGAPVGTPVVSVGSNNGGTYPNQYIRRLTFYPRKLTDTELGALVA